MKIKICFIIIFAAQTHIIFSQQGWFVQYSPMTEQLRSVFFADSNTGWACGNNGKIVKTINGGINWIQQASGIDHNLNSIFFLNENTGWSCGGKVNAPAAYLYSIIKTTNGGLSWQTIFNQVSTYTIFFTDIHFINESTGMVIGSSFTSLVSLGLIMKTSNGGLNWGGILSDSISRHTMSFANSATGFLSCNYFRDYTDIYTYISYVLKTTNYGANWTTVYSTNDRSIFPLTCSDANNILGGGMTIASAGVVSLSHNGGTNWSQVYPDSSGDILSVFSPDANNAWATTYNKKILRSTDGGSNWASQQNPVNLRLYDLHFTNSLTGWAVGDSGKILKTTTGGIAGFRRLSNVFPEKFVLFQNYPNPFNPVTKIKFSIPAAPLSSIGEGQGVRLMIYDALGREVAVLVYERLSPGTYEVEWNGSNYPSGVYFYKLTAGDYAETRKMILIK